MIFFSHLATRKSTILPSYVLVAATRGAGEQLSRTLAKELAPRGITVNTVTPGLVDVRALLVLPLLPFIPSSSLHPFISSSLHPFIPLSSEPALHRLTMRFHAQQTPGMRATYSEHKISFLAGIHPGGRLGTPGDIAALCGWLCGRDASFVSGQCIQANGVSCVFCLRGDG